MRTNYNLRMLAMTIMTIATFTLSLTSCEKVSLDELISKGNTIDGNYGKACLLLNVGGLENATYGNSSEIKTTRSVEPVENVCTKLTVALYKADGTRAFVVNQKATDSDFGKVKAMLAEGSYTLLVVAHSNDKNATTTKLDEITFDGKVSDTFHYSQQIDLKDGQTPLNIMLARITAMFRLEITDDIPENAKQLKFYYTGGSSTIDGVSGYGSKDSRQTEYRDIVSGKTYDVYTFPHMEKKNLKMTITALDSSGNALCEKSFDDVDVSRNVITHYRGKLFENVVSPSQSSDFEFSIVANTDWLEEKVVDF